MFSFRDSKETPSDLRVYEECIRTSIILDNRLTDVRVDVAALSIADTKLSGRTNKLDETFYTHRSKTLNNAAVSELRRRGFNNGERILFKMDYLIDSRCLTTLLAKSKIPNTK